MLDIFFQQLLNTFLFSPPPQKKWGGGYHFIQLLCLSIKPIVNKGN